MTPANRQRFKDLVLQDSQQRYPNLPDHTRSITVPKDTDTNGLTRCVLKWIELHGYQAERISSTGRWIDNSSEVTDIIGRRMRIGSGKWIKGNGTPGTADISATIRGKAVKIEIKYGKDRQSVWQKRYQESIEASGGVYLIVRKFDDFVNWWDSWSQ